MMPSEKSSFLRRSGVRNADANAESTEPPALTDSSNGPTPRAGPRPANLTGQVGTGPCACNSGVPETGIWAVGVSMVRVVERLARPGADTSDSLDLCSDLGDGAPGSGDLLPGRGRERVRSDLEPHPSQVTLAEHL